MSNYTYISATMTSTVFVPTLSYYYFSQKQWPRYIIDDEKGIGPFIWVEDVSYDSAVRRVTALHPDTRWYEYQGRMKIPVIHKPYDHPTSHHFLHHDRVYIHHHDGRIERVGPELATDGR